MKVVIASDSGKKFVMYLLCFVLKLTVVGLVNISFQNYCFFKLNLHV